VIRGAWIVCALLLLANMVASIPAYYRLMNTVCGRASQGDCIDNSGQLSADTAQLLAQLHISLSAYAAYFVTLDVIVSLLPLGIGFLVFWRKSDEWMGLFVGLLLILWGANGASNTLAGLWMPSPPTPLFTFLLNASSAVQWIGLGIFLLTFPTGRFAPRWSWLLLSFWILTFIQPTLPIVPAMAPLEGLASLVQTIVVFGGTLFIVVYRYRHVFHAPQRQQTKWVVYAAIAWFIVYLIGTSLASLLPAQSPYQLLAPTIIIIVPQVFIFLGLGFAILRYRLWDIDTIINRTLVYGTLTTILTLTYVGVILLLHAITATVTGQAGDPPPAIVVSTLLIIALFNPLRRRIQTLIDRRFYRRKYDARKILAAFTTTLRTEVDLANLSEHLVLVVEETMQPMHAWLWLRQSSVRSEAKEERSIN
jgi:hypothetical protein